VPAASPDIAFLNTKIPIVYVSDATLALLLDYYPKFSKVLSISRKEADLIDRLAFSKSSLLVFSSEWAANSSINHYGANRDKVKIIPFGANIEKVLRKRTPNLERRHVCKLLFLRKDWVRKGGKLAFDTLLQLEKMGMPSKLLVCGCLPPKELSHRNMILVGWAKKTDDLLSEADFLLLPTRAECFGIVFCEASAYGVPIISTNTGGVSGAVKNGENGFLLDITAGAADYAETIFRIWNDRRLYHNLQKKCMKAFSERLNWDSWGVSMQRIIDEARSQLTKNTRDFKNRD
jgi:glycosyltransferase involved in cell wall biosynthesis